MHTTISYQDIADGQYKWGQYGDFKVLIRTADGYINVTKLCKDGGREFFHWTRLDGSKGLLNEFEMSKDKLIHVVTGGVNTIIRGSYAHPDLVPHIASWISPQFAVFMSRVLREWRSYSKHNESIYWDELKKAVEDDTPRIGDKEKQYQLQIAAEESGICEVQTDYGFIDVLTKTKVIEIKNACTWKHAIGQVFIYGISYPERERWIYLFDCTPESQSVIEHACGVVGVRVRFLGVQ